MTRAARIRAAIADNAPAEWTVVTRDLFKDFGPMTLQGLALTPMDSGGHAMFDHCYLGATMADLDLASADAFGKTPLKTPLVLLEIGELWEDLANADIDRAGKAVGPRTAGETGQEVAGFTRQPAAIRRGAPPMPSVAARCRRRG